MINFPSLEKSKRIVLFFSLNGVESVKISLISFNSTRDFGKESKSLWSKSIISKEEHLPIVSGKVFILVPRKSKEVSSFSSPIVEGTSWRYENFKWISFSFLHSFIECGKLMILILLHLNYYYI